jgi:hypothetical protein
VSDFLATDGGIMQQLLNDENYQIQDAQDWMVQLSMASH